MLQCKEVVALVSSGEWRTEPLHRRLALALHLAMCRHCRGYARSLRQIGGAVRRLYHGEPVDAERSEETVKAVRRAAEQSRTD